MDFGGLRDLVLELNLSAHGMDMVVTRPAPDDDPIDEAAAGGPLRGIWLTTTTEDRPLGSSFVHRDARRAVAFSRLDVPTLPIGSRIYAPERMGGTPVYWTVDAHEDTFADHWRVLVVPSLELEE